RRTDLSMTAPAPPGALVVEYEEQMRPTIIKRGTEGDLVTHGRFWIDPLDGRVLMTELAAEDSQFSAMIEVAYRAEPGIEPLVPIEMRERYLRRRDGSRTDGVATYSRFRRFQ